MTFCASLGANFKWTESFLLILTHRRGAAVSLFQSHKLDEETSLEVSPEGQSCLERIKKRFSFSKLDPVQEKFFCLLFSLKDKIREVNVVGSPGRSVVFGFGEKTAESLALLTAQVLEHAVGVQDWGSVQAIAGGFRPKGSFTGLRLGASYANGLALSLKAKRYSVRAFFPDEMEGLVPEFSEDLDRFQTPLHWLDLCCSLLSIDQSVVTSVDYFQPEYGAEPGPVLKLKGNS